ncbi:MAG TPA: hypothetical protein VK172_14765 [Lentimicrobium sp.]|nr:hypothetical protein [Bacteroidales bacterium]HLO92424.1 hypothetical protein [Lentimicrobium sp.]
MKHTFIFTDEKVLNSYGFRVMTSGGRFEQFNANPLILWMHRRPNKYNDKNADNDVFPIGLGSNVRIKDGQGLVDVEFDEKDPFAQKIAQKVESGIVRMASAGIDPITWTEDPKMLLEGQKCATLAEWNLVEISIVDIGSNPMALKLYNANKELIELTAGNQHDFIPLLKKEPKTQTKNMEFLAQVAVLLGKQPDAALDSVTKALNERLQLAAKAEEYKLKYETLVNEVAQATEKTIISLVDAAVDRKITADEKDFYVKLGKDSGIDALKAVLERLPAIKTSKQIILGKEGPSGSGEKEIKTFSDLKEQGMQAIELCRKNEPEKYKNLFKAEYGYEPDMAE